MAIFIFQVFCLKDGAAAAPDACDSDALLLSEEDCNKDPCPEASGDEEPSSGEFVTSLLTLPMFFS